MKRLMIKLEALGRRHLHDRWSWRLSPAGQQWLARFLPWLTMVVIMLVLPWLLLAITIGASLGIAGAAAGTTFRPIYYLSVIVLLVETTIALMALPALFRRRLVGWRLLFYAVGVHMAYGLLRWLAEPAALFSLFWSLAITLVALYWLFQVRGQYRH